MASGVLDGSIPVSSFGDSDEFFFLYGNDDFVGVDLKPTSLQFFFDLFGYGAIYGSEDILVSFLGSDSDKQTYALYSGADSADLQYFFSSILNRPAFIFQGTFQPVPKKDGTEQLVTWQKRQRTLNAICVDIDGPEYFDGKHPIDPETFEYLWSLVDPRFKPSYICLSGNGIHLWYVFARPIQTFTNSSARRRKLKAFTRALYRYFSIIFEGYDVSVDDGCATLNHCFRAPGSLTKYGDMVLCFCPKEAVFGSSAIDAVELSNSASFFLDFEYPEADVLTYEDLVFKSPGEITAEHNAWLQKKRDTPASEKQLMFLRELEEQGSLKSDEASLLSGINSLDAGALIHKALNRRGSGNKTIGDVNDYSQWTVKPHWLIAGKSGGVYSVILDNIQKVKVGRRYTSLHMLAGVAYMMVRPEKSRASVEEDFLALLKTRWARAGIPLTERDIKNALQGYNPDNWQSRDSIIAALGFDPFGPSAKRNYRSQQDHLDYVARKKKARCLDEMLRVMRATPGCRKSFVISETGLAKGTVYKYWDEALSRLETLS